MYAYARMYIGLRTSSRREYAMADMSRVCSRALMRLREVIHDLCPSSLFIFFKHVFTVKHVRG